MSCLYERNYKYLYICDCYPEVFKKNVIYFNSETIFKKKKKKTENSLKPINSITEALFI